MKKLLFLFAIVFSSSIINAQVCSTGVTAIDFSPVANSTDMQLQIHSSCCQIHHFDNYTITSNGSNHIVNLCYVDTGLLMPSDIVVPITLSGLNSGGEQNFIFNVHYYYYLTNEDCTTNTAYSSSFPLTVDTPLTQARTFQLSVEEQHLKKTSLFPNPNSGNFALQLPSGIQQVQLTITDLSGKTVATISNYISGDSIELKGISKGLYFAKVVSPQATEMLKFIIE